MANANGFSLTRVTHSGQAPKNIRWSRKSSGLIYFLNGSGEFRSTRAAGAFGVSIGGLTSEPMRINFQARMTVKRDEEFTEMFVQCWRALSDTFYDPQYPRRRTGTPCAPSTSRWLAMSLSGRTCTRS